MFPQIQGSGVTVRKIALKRLLGFVVVVLALTTPAAMAQVYPPAVNGVTSPTGTTYAPGALATFVAQTFLPGSNVTFTLFSDPITLGTVAANSSGVATLQTKIPASVPAGAHTVRASGTGANGQPLNVDLVVTVAGSTLSRTGATHTQDLTRAGVAALVFGGLLVLASKKRRARIVAARENASVG